MESPRLKALQNLSAQIPVANQRVAQGQQAARDIQLQQAVKAAPTTTNIPAQAQATGAQVAQAAGQQAVQNAESQVKQQGQVGQLAVQATQQGIQQQVAGARQGAAEQALSNTERLSKLDQNLKKELVDDQIKFSTDEAGRTLFNTKQLEDYVRTAAVSDEQAQQRMQLIKQATDRKLQAMEQAYKLMEQDLIQKQALAEKQKDFESTKELGRIRQEAQKKMERERARAANRAAVATAVGTIVGGAIGAKVAGATGAQTGSQLGGAAGSMAASQTQ